MFRGYRGIIVALVGLVLLGAGQPPKADDASKAQPAQSEITKAANAVAAAITEASKPGEEDRGCEDRSDIRSSDLCAQWKAADAARDAADYARWSLLVGILGTSLLIWTLWETRQMAIREQRAYIKIEPCEGGMIREGLVCLPYDVINYGTTPAIDLNVAIVTAIRAADWNWEQEPAVLGQGQRRKVTLHPESPLVVNAEIKGVTEALFNAIMEGQCAVFVQVSVTYRDVFRRDRHTRIRQFYHGGGANEVTTGRLRNAPGGHEFS